MELKNKDYVLVLENRIEVKDKQEVGKLPVVSGIDGQDNLKTTEATASNQAAFLKFNNKNGLVKNFISNIFKQFNALPHFGQERIAI